VLRRSDAPLSDGMVDSILRRRGPSIGSVMVIVTIVSAGIVLAPAAVADQVATLRDAVASLRS